MLFITLTFRQNALCKQRTALEAVCQPSEWRVPTSRKVLGKLVHGKGTRFLNKVYSRNHTLARSTNAESRKDVERATSFRDLDKNSSSRKHSARRVLFD